MCSIFGLPINTLWPYNESKLFVFYICYIWRLFREKLTCSRCSRRRPYGGVLSERVNKQTPVLNYSFGKFTVFIYFPFFLSRFHSFVLKFFFIQSNSFLLILFLSIFPFFLVFFLFYDSFFLFSFFSSFSFLLWLLYKNKVKLLLSWEPFKYIHHGEKEKIHLGQTLRWTKCFITFQITWFEVKVLLFAI